MMIRDINNGRIMRTCVMALVMMVMGQGSAWAEADTWDGTTKLTTIAAAGIEGDGKTPETAYIIDSANKFVAFGTLANNSTAYWKLTADINLGGYEWPYSGNNAKTFKGHFDGGGHIVCNYKITPVTNKANGLFGTVQGSSATNRAEIKNLKLDDVTITASGTLGSTTYISALVGNASQYVDFENIQIVDANSNDNTVTITVENINGNCNIGSLAGAIQKNSTIKNCTVNKPVIDIQGAETVGGNSNIGGVIGNFTGASGSITSITDPTPSDNQTTGLTVTSPSVTINKIASSWYIGSVIGRINNYSDVNYVSVSNPTLVYKAVGSPNNALYLGTFTGHIQGNVGSTSATPVSTPVKNITITGTSTITIGTGTEEIKNVRAGVVGQATTNVDIDTWSIATSTITVNGSLTTSADFLGGVIGQVTSATTTSEDDVSTKVKNVTLTNSTISITGSISKESYIGGAFGRIEGTAGNASKNQFPQQTLVSGLHLTGTSSLVVCTNNNDIINYVRAGVAGMANTNVKLENWDIANTSIKVNGKFQTTASSVGGCVGVMQSTSNAPASATNIKVTNSCVVDIIGDVEKEVYVGGAFGRVDASSSTQNQAATAENVTVAGLNMSFGGDFKQNVYAGGIVGYLYSMNITNCPDPTSVVNCSVSGQIHSSASKTLKEGLYYAFGGIVGYNNQNATTNQSIISQCVSEVSFNFGGYTPATATNLTKMFFIIGGVIGRLDNPSLLPEHLYYSGKIYAPYAAVGPIVGTFYKNAGAAYVYEDYSGEYAAPTLTSAEWEKANTWYYHDYKLGLSESVRTQTDRTRNYSAATTTIDGVEYLTINDATFSAPNAVNGGKVSKTVLRYTANNKNIDFGIYPQWTTSSSAYPTYYMYYMQGVNRGVYMSNEQFAKELIKRQVSVSASMQTAQTGSSYTFTANIGDIAGKDGFTIAYQWYKSDESTAIDGKTSNTITLTESELTTYGGTVYCKITVSGTGFSNVAYTLKGSNTYVVFIDGAKGVDNTAGSTARGWTPETAVRTIDHANSLLRDVEHGGTWDNNIIVVMGLLNSDYKFQSNGTNPATLTGKWEGKDYNGIIRLDQIDPVGGEHKVNPIAPGVNGSNCYILGDTKFENLIFYGNKKGNCFIELHGRDAIFGKGLVMQNFKNLAKNHGNLGEKEKVPEFTIILTATNLSEEVIKSYTVGRTKPQKVTFQSGHYGRLMGGRFTQHFFADAANTAHSILASAENPIWAEVNIEIDKNNEMTDGLGNVYTCDINGMIAGLTDGTMYGDYTINFRGGSVAYIVGGNQGNAVNNGSLRYTPLGGTEGAWGQWPNASFFGRSVINVEQDTNLKTINVGNLYAGGLGRESQSGAATATVDMYMYGRTEVNVKSGTISGNVYGGGVGGVIGSNPWDAHVPYATTAADAANNAILNKVQYGDTRYGKWSSMVNGTDDLATVTLHNLNDDGKTYSTENLNLAQSSTTVNIYGGEVKGSVYGGGYGFVQDMPVESAMQGIGSVFGNTNININGGTIGGNVYGGSEGSSQYYNGVNKYGQKVTNIAEMNGAVTMNISGNTIIKGNIFGAGEGIASTPSNEYVNIARTGNSELGYPSTINMTIDLPHSQTFTGNIYGGGELGLVDGDANITIKGGVFGDIVDAKVVNGSIFGGGKGENGHPNKAKMTGNISVTINMTDAEDLIRGDVYGGGELATVMGNATVLVDGTGAVHGAVYGGGSLANLGGNTTVNLFGGSVGSAYGGGLGAKAGVNGALTDVAAIVGGDATVTLGKDRGDGSFVASKVTGEGIFGCNNLNGTPKGHVKVHVLKTTTRGQANRNETGSTANFDVAAVYGGGNKAAYEPTSENEYPEVLIENCDNSIAYVYGGGNAAPVPATDVTILGANAIDNAFAGGNGEGIDNLGADIGYLDYTRDDVHKYGLGTASIKVYGGTVHNVYGGSNTLGYIRTSTTVDAKEDVTKSSCAFNVGNMYGGGNKAEITCDIVLNFACHKGAKTLYAGSNQANILGNATINIYSGVFEQVFGGNNQSGVIKGKLTINVDETGCWPIMIGELYGCGNDAPYSVYGYKADNTPRTSLENLSQETITQEGLPYADPEINIISCTKIGRVFGGGYSKGATVYGNTHVNVNLIPGRWNGQEVQPDYNLNSNYEMVSNTSAITIPEGIGEIGNIYGGGNAAGVVGNTYVNIYTNKTNHHIDNPDPNGYIINKEEQESGVNIKGDVYGGSKGLDSNPEAGKVTGTTSVLIGTE